MNKQIDAVGLLEEGKEIQIMPEGFSMYPMFIPKRDWAILKKADSNQIKRSDVVLYKRASGLLVLHRIWKIKKDGVYLVGDNQSEIEGPINREQIKGILVAFLRKGRRYSVHNPIYLFLSRGWLFLFPCRGLIQRLAKGFRSFYKHKR